MRGLDIHKADKTKHKNYAENAKSESILEAFEYIV